MNIFLETIQNKKIGLNPIWIMRQAGRYLPEYLDTRSKAGDFLSLCYNPVLASEVTLQPIRRFGFDAAIIFSDILVIPHGLGLNVEYEKGEGPTVQKYTSHKDLSKKNFLNKLSPVYEAIRRTRDSLDKEKALIGFAGAPWTLATYMIEGKGSKSFDSSKILAFNRDQNFLDLMEILVESISEHLCNQIEAGADVVQIFDSWASVLPEQEFIDFVILPTKRIVKNIRKTYPHIPIIGFPKGVGFMINNYLAHIHPDVIGLDSGTPVEIITDATVTQGNIDPIILLSSKNAIHEAVTKLKQKVANKAHIFNLGHGILKETPIENVQYFIDEVRR